MSRAIKFLIIFIIAIIIIGTTSTFALWVVNKKQTTLNSLKSGCVHLTFTSGTGSLSLQNAAPITDAQGLALTGYTFTVQNNCSDEVSYLLNLDLFNVDGSTNLTANDIKLAIDNKVPRKLSFFDNITNNDSTAYGAKTLYTGKIAAKSSDTHTIKMWVDENVTTQNAVFSNRLFTMSNPNLTVSQKASDDCFIMNGNGKILMYKTAYCPSDVVIPNVIQNQTVTGVAEGAFRDANVISIYNNSNQTVDFVILDEDNYDTLASIITSIVTQDITNNNGIEGLVPNYQIYRASLYTGWNSFDGGLLNGQISDEAIDGSVHNSSNTHRLNIPIDLNATDYYNQSHGFLARNFDANYNCSSCYYGGNGLTNNEAEHYLTKIDFSNCTSLSSFDQLAISYNDDLTKIEVPNNSNFVFENSCFASNSLSQIFIPTATSSIKTGAFSNNNISNVELYSTNSLLLYSSAFGNNNISNLIVNSTIDVSNVTTKPFVNNQLTSSDITIGYNSTNTASDFIDIN